MEQKKIKVYDFFQKSQNLMKWWETTRNVPRSTFKRAIRSRATFWVVKMRFRAPYMAFLWGAAGSQGPKAGYGAEKVEIL